MLAYLGKLGLPSNILELLEKYSAIASLAVIAVGILLAFFGYKLFKAILIIGGTVGAGAAVDMFLIPLFADKLPEVPMIGLSGLIVLVVAALGALLAYKAQKLVIFLGCGAAGYFFVGGIVGDLLVKQFPDMAFLSSTAGEIVISAVCALVLAIIGVIFFKLLFILITSIGGMGLAGAFLGNLVITEMNDMLIYVCFGAGAVIGIIALVYQFKTNPKFKQIY